MRTFLDFKERPKNFSICAVGQRNITSENFLLGFSVIYGCLVRLN